MNHSAKNARHEQDRKRHREEQKQHAREAAKRPKPVWPAWALGVGLSAVALAVLAMIVLR